MSIFRYSSFVVFAFMIACQTFNNDDTNVPTQQQDSSISQVEIPQLTYPLDRNKIRASLQQKTQNKEALTIHIFIPLCDSKHQGIAQTKASLSDGMDIKGNLYWATSSATKRFFTKHKNWDLIHKTSEIDTNVLERVVFERDYEQAKVYLIADAYRGDRMEECINDFFAAASTNKVGFAHKQIRAYGDADFLIFNGHNGMMDNIKLREWQNDSDIPKDVFINACLARDYFDEPLQKANAYPLLRSKILLHPGAYVITQVIDDWVAGIADSSLALNAGRAYCDVQDCDLPEEIYHTGW